MHNRRPTLQSDNVLWCMLYEPCIINVEVHIRYTIEYLKLVWICKDKLINPPFIDPSHSPLFYTGRGLGSLEVPEFVPFLNCLIENIHNCGHKMINCIMSGHTYFSSLYTVNNSQHSWNFKLFEFQCHKETPEYDWAGLKDWAILSQPNSPIPVYGPSSMSPCLMQDKWIPLKCHWLLPVFIQKQLKETLIQFSLLGPNEVQLGLWLGVVLWFCLWQ